MQVINKVSVPDRATATADVQIVITTIRFTEAEIMAIRVMLIRDSINITSNKVSNAVIKTDLTAVTNTEATGTVR